MVFHNVFRTVTVASGVSIEILTRRTWWWNVIAVLLYLHSNSMLCASDIRSDAMPSSDVVVGSVDALPVKQERKAVAMAAFARFFMNPSAEQLKQSLYTVLENDPEANTPLRIALFTLGKSSEADEILKRMKGIAKRNPHALAMNLAVIAYLCDHRKYSEAEKLAQHCLEAVEVSGKTSVRDLEFYANIVALRGVIFNKTQAFKAGEDFFDSILENEVLNNNFTVMESAVRFYYFAAKQSSDKPFLWVMESDRERVRGKIEKLLQHLEDVADNAERIVSLADVYDSIAMPERAEAVLMDYLIARGDDEYIISALIRLLAAGKDNRALLYREKLLKMKPNNPVYLRKAAIAAMREKYSSRAIVYFKHYLELRPGDPGIVLQLAMMYVEVGDFESALALLKTQPVSFYILEGIGIVKLHQSDYSGALKVFKDAAKLLPVAEYKLYFCINMLMAAECCADVETLKKYAEIIIRNFPTRTADYDNALGYTLANHNIKLDLAEKLLKHAIKHAPEKMEVLDSMAWLYYRRQNYPEALRYIKLSLKAGVKYPHAVIADHAGDIYLAAGDKKSALRYWNIALKTYSADLNRAAVLKKISQYANHGN